MASHPYISGAGNITQMIGFLRKNFPTVVTSDTVKKLGVAPKNESYIINALQFIGVIDQEGKRTDRGHEVLTTHDEEAFKKAFQGLIRDGYKDLFDLRGDDAWKMSKDELIGYFRSTDKTSDLIGNRQASVFQAFQALAGHEQNKIHAAKNGRSAKPSLRVSTSKMTKANNRSRNESTRGEAGSGLQDTRSKKDMALTVRIEINLPAEASAETYDNIFKSMRANLLNE